MKTLEEIEQHIAALVHAAKAEAEQAEHALIDHAAGLGKGLFQILHHIADKLEAPRDSAIVP